MFIGVVLLVIVVGIIWGAIKNSINKNTNLPNVKNENYISREQTTQFTDEYFSKTVLEVKKWNKIRDNEPVITEAKTLFFINVAALITLVDEPGKSSLYSKTYNQLYKNAWDLLRKNKMCYNEKNGSVSESWFRMQVEGGKFGEKLIQSFNIKKNEWETERKLIFTTALLIDEMVINYKSICITYGSLKYFYGNADEPQKINTQRKLEWVKHGKYVEKILSLSIFIASKLPDAKIIKSKLEQMKLLLKRSADLEE